MSPLRAVRNVVLCLLTAVLCGAAVYHVRTEPRAEVLRSKRLFYGEHRESYDVVFVGSSLTFRSIDPAVFDETMAALGHPVRSYNLAVMGMGSHEADHLLRSLLEDPPARLAHAFIELGPWLTPVSDGDAMTDRLIEWHSFASFRLLLESLRLSPAPWPSRLLDLGQHALHTFLKYASVGRGVRIVERALGCEDRAIPEEEAYVADAAGYEPLHVDTREVAHRRRRERFLDNIPRFRADVQRTRDGNAQPADLTRYNRLALESQVAAVRAAGVEPVYVIPPHPEPSPELHALAELGVVPVLFAFNDPDRYPGLFQPERYFDERHLEAESARAFTRRLAQLFATHLEGRSP